MALKWGGGGLGGRLAPVTGSGARSAPQRVVEWVRVAELQSVAELQLVAGLWPQMGQGLAAPLFFGLQRGVGALASCWITPH